jgi:hypothetical protein
MFPFLFPIFLIDFQPSPPRSACPEFSVTETVEQSLTGCTSAPVRRSGGERLIPPPLPEWKSPPIFLRLPDVGRAMPSLSEGKTPRIDCPQYPVSEEPSEPPIPPVPPVATPEPPTAAILTVTGIVLLLLLLLGWRRETGGRRFRV